MRKALALLVVTAAAALAGGLTVACGDDNASTNDGGPEGGSSGSSSGSSSSSGSGSGSSGGSSSGSSSGMTGCGNDDAGMARTPFTCCVMGLIDMHTNNTDLPDPGFCNTQMDNQDPAQFDKYFP